MVALNVAVWSASSFISFASSSSVSHFFSAPLSMRGSSQNESRCSFVMASQSYTSALNAVPDGAGNRREQPQVSNRSMSSQ